MYTVQQIEVFSDQSDSEPNPLQAAIDLAKPGDTVMLNAGMVSNGLLVPAPELQCSLHA